MVRKVGYLNLVKFHFFRETFLHFNLKIYTIHNNKIIFTMKKFLFVFLIGLLLSPVFSTMQTSAAEPLTYNAVQDTFANLAYPDRDFSSMSSVVISIEPTVRMGYFSFEDITLPESGILQSVIFNYYISDIGGSENETTPLEFRNIGTEWNEETLNWGNTPVTSGNIYESVPLTIGWHEANITELAEDWYGIYMVNNGIYVGQNGIDEPSVTIASSGSDNVPYIEVNYNIDMPAPPVECPLTISFPADEGEISDTRPVFSWEDLTCLSSDVFEVRLFVNQISDDGADTSEIINISIPVDSSFFTPTEDLDSANYRWYIATVNSDGIGIDRSESNDFEITEDATDKEDDKNEKDKTTGKTDDDKSPKEDSAQTPNSSIMLYVVLVVCLMTIAIIVTSLVLRPKKDKPIDGPPQPPTV